MFCRRCALGSCYLAAPVSSSRSCESLNSPRCSVALLLAPAYPDVFTKDQCEDILNLVFTFIDQSGRRL